MRSRITPAHRRRALSITAITVAVVAVSLAGASAANATSRVAYGDSVPNWAIAQNDAGAVPAYQTYERGGLPPVTRSEGR